MRTAIRWILAWQIVVGVVMAIAFGARALKGPPSLPEEDARWLASVIEPTEKDLSRSRLAARMVGVAHQRARDFWSDLVQESMEEGGAGMRFRMAKGSREAPEDLSPFYAAANEGIPDRLALASPAAVAVELGDGSAALRERLGAGGPGAPDPRHHELWLHVLGERHARALVVAERDVGLASFGPGGWRSDAGIMAALEAISADGADLEARAELVDALVARGGGDFHIAELELRHRLLADLETDEQRGIQWQRLAASYRNGSTEEARSLATAAARVLARSAVHRFERAEALALLADLEEEAGEHARARALHVEVAENFPGAPIWSASLFTAASMLREDGYPDQARALLERRIEASGELEAMSPDAQVTDAMERHRAAEGIAGAYRAGWVFPMALVWEGKARSEHPVEGWCEDCGPGAGGERFQRGLLAVLFTGPLLAIALLPVLLGAMGWALLAALVLVVTLLAIPATQPKTRARRR